MPNLHTPKLEPVDSRLTEHKATRIARGVGVITKDTAGYPVRTRLGPSDPSLSPPWCQPAAVPLLLLLRVVASRSSEQGGGDAVTPPATWSHDEEAVSYC
ncbi:hypothetical protein E2562_005802 [Oryza meyeriana var. granulata]|uniref:Uncharacterized protein n=1 Tax=Oryza meyeriana var. granulata TaxID=110450 RepID=A0A6G1F4R7_9ORYZ|nr:hypothetical protein E2562_005802 [Oryza meyeriana var. granulata]